MGTEQGSFNQRAPWAQVEEASFINLIVAFCSLIAPRAGQGECHGSSNSAKFWS